MQELKGLHLYCGAGGMSFVGGRHDCQQHLDLMASPSQQQRPCNLVHIRSCWAVDHEEAMCRSFSANHSDAKVKTSAWHAATCPELRPPSCTRALRR